MENYYFDNAATTPMAETAIATLMKEMQENYGNASSVHTLGRNARKVVDQSRQILAKSINAKESEIFFTSGGTESNNLAIFGTMKYNPRKHIITTSIEHPSVLNAMKELETEGFEVTYLPVDETGQINLDDLKNSLNEDTALVSIMAVNNEIGTINPLTEIGEIVAQSNALFHVDNVQGYGNITVDVEKMKIDLLSVSAHKVNGPKFLGFLFKRDGVNLDNLLFGGEQERKLRPGTENVPAIASFGAVVAAEINPAEIAADQEKFLVMQNYLVDSLNDAGVAFTINGGIDANHSHHVLNLYLHGVKTYVMQTNLDLAGFMISGGSACTAGSLEPSSVIQAITDDQERVEDSIRISFGRQNTMDEVKLLAKSIIDIYNRITV